MCQGESHGVRPSRMSALWLQMSRPGTPLSHPLSGSQPGLLKKGEKAGKQRKKMGKRQPLFPAGKIAMTLFSFFAFKSPRELSLPFHMS
jgi:hypothetical protein